MAVGVVKGVEPVTPSVVRGPVPRSSVDEVVTVGGVRLLDVELLVSTVEGVESPPLTAVSGRPSPECPATIVMTGE